MTGKGVSVCTFTVAVDRRFKQDNQPTADFFNCVAFKGLADNISNYTKKGSKVFVAGPLQNRSYVAQDGSKRYVTEIICEECEFLDRKSQDQPEESQGFGSDIDDEDMPF